MITNEASTNLVTDSSRYLLFRRTIDDELRNEVFRAHFRLSLPLGNRGLLNIDSPETDLEPVVVDGVDASLCQKPFGLWLAISFDDPDRGADDDTPVKQKEGPALGKRKRPSGSRQPSTLSGAETRSRRGGGGSGGPGGAGRSGRPAGGGGRGVGAASSLSRISLKRSIPTDTLVFL